MIKRLNAERGVSPSETERNLYGNNVKPVRGEELKTITVGGDKLPQLTPAAFDVMFGSGKPKSQRTAQGLLPHLEKPRILPTRQRGR